MDNQIFLVAISMAREFLILKRSRRQDKGKSFIVYYICITKSILHLRSSLPQHNIHLTISPIFFSSCQMAKNPIFSHNFFSRSKYSALRIYKNSIIDRILLVEIIIIKMARTISIRPSKPSKPAKARRTSSMEKCVADAEDFLAPRKAKKITKTRTMARTLEEGQKMLMPKRKITAAKAKKTAVRKIPLLPAVPSWELPIAPPPVPPASTGSKIIRARSIDKSLKPSKVTIFKTSSRDNLPLSAFGFIDICFCVDATGSMGSELAQVQSTIVTIIKNIESKVRTEGITLRFAIVTYRDHPPQESSYVTQYQDFTDANEAITYVNRLSASGGGDEPEAVHDGLIDACQKLNWVEMPGTPMLRYIFHIADAPPHGKEFLNGQSHEGCLCGKTTLQVAHEINARQIHYRLIKVRNNIKVDEMEKIFKKSIVDFDSAQITAAHEMNIRISDMIIHEIMPQG